MPSSQPLTLKDRVISIQGALPPSVRLIAVSKYMPAALIREAYDAGLRDFGESRVQEAIQKQAELQDLSGLTWHLIGHLQSNKAKLAVRHFDWIHSVDSLALAQRLNRIVESVEHSPQLCLQVKPLSDPDKFGWMFADLKTDLPALQACSHLRWRGLMTILPMGLTSQETLNAFHETQKLAQDISQPSQENFTLSELSMGMSKDYQLAVQAGATMVRVGRSLFGDRPLP
ncbi:YggS family pyridoxal phosphate-dependent enzyme [Acaryochloris marina NIES-2412]|uniref:YggS family pyridoxal phosphate-dependent enzyme n=1 Tax=Acaryochloris marina TaxID=155978 RepID=UPI0040584410